LIDQDRIVQHEAMHIREQTTMQKQTRSTVDQL